MQTERPEFDDDVTGVYETSWIVCLSPNPWRTLRIYPETRGPRGCPI